MEHLLYHIIRHITEEVPRLSLIDEDYGQLENLDQTSRDMYPLTFPAVLVEVSDIRWSSVQGNNQKGEASIRVRLLVDCYDDTHAGSSTEFAILERDELRRALDATLQGFRPTADGGMMRERSTFFTFNHGIKVYETHYTLSVSECFREERQTATSPTVTINAKATRP